MVPSAIEIAGMKTSYDPERMELIKAWEKALIIPRDTETIGGFLLGNFLCKIETTSGEVIWGVINTSTANFVDNGVLSIPITKGGEKIWNLISRQNHRIFGRKNGVKCYQTLGIENQRLGATRETSSVQFLLSTIGGWYGRGLYICPRKVFSSGDERSQKSRIGLGLSVEDPIKAWATAEELKKAFPEFQTIEPVDFKAWLAEARKAKAKA